MPRVKKINPDTAPEEVKKAIADHLAKGHRLTNGKLTLLHSVPAFNAIKVGSYDLDDELASIIGKRAADIYEYAISSANDCIVCTVYFKKLLDSEDIDINNFQFTKGNTQAMAEAVPIIICRIPAASAYFILRGYTYISKHCSKRKSVFQFMAGRFAIIGVFLYFPCLIQQCHSHLRCSRCIQHAVSGFHRSLPYVPVSFPVQTDVNRFFYIQKSVRLPQSPHHG